MPSREPSRAPASHRTTSSKRTRSAWSGPSSGSITAAARGPRATRRGGSGARCATRSPPHGPSASPRRPNRQLAAVRHTEAELGRHRPRQASNAEIADATQLSVSTVRSLRTAARVTASLDEPVGEDATPLGNLIADSRAVDPAESAIAHEQRDDVSAMLGLLPKRHREVLVRRDGLNGSSVQSHNEIGRRLGVGEVRSRQIERESLHRLGSLSGTWRAPRSSASARPAADSNGRPDPTLRDRAPARVSASEEKSRSPPIAECEIAPMRAPRSPAATSSTPSRASSSSARHDLRLNRLRRANDESGVAIAASIFLDVFNAFLLFLDLFGGERDSLKLRALLGTQPGRARWRGSSQAVAPARAPMSVSSPVSAPRTSTITGQWASAVTRRVTPPISTARCGP
jgi:DNA-binding CsgD family transcriptional regulator